LFVACSVFQNGSFVDIYGRREGIAVRSNPSKGTFIRQARSWSSEDTQRWPRTLLRFMIPQGSLHHHRRRHHKWQNSLSLPLFFKSQPSLEDSAGLHPVFTSLDFTTIFFYTKVVSLVSPLPPTYLKDSLQSSNSRHRLRRLVAGFAAARVQTRVWSCGIL
jgi:hypothetical protein